MYIEELECLVEKIAPTAIIEQVRIMSRISDPCREISRDNPQF